MRNQNDILNIKNSAPIVIAIIEDETTIRTIFEEM
jgi:PII-like signaling protein